MSGEPSEDLPRQLAPGYLDAIAESLRPEEHPQYDAMIAAIDQAVATIQQVTATIDET